MLTLYPGVKTTGFLITRVVDLDRIPPSVE